MVTLVIVKPGPPKPAITAAAPPPEVTVTWANERNDEMVKIKIRADFRPERIKELKFIILFDLKRFIRRKLNKKNELRFILKSVK
jgi:hypothetical protein